MTSAQGKRQKLLTSGEHSGSGTNSDSASGPTQTGTTTTGSATITNSIDDELLLARKPTTRSSGARSSGAGTLGNELGERENNNDDDDDDDDDDEDEDDDDDEDEDDDDDEDDDQDDDNNAANGTKLNGGQRRGRHTHATNAPSASGHSDIQEQLAAAGPAGVAAAAAIASARKRKRTHTFETNPSVRKRQQTRLIRKLRACIDEYTMRVGQQAVVLIAMPGKTAHNFKVFGAQPLESVIRACKQEVMCELEQALLEQAPQQFKDDANKHELPALVIDGIPTPVEKMTQAQLRAFIPLMLKYSTGRGKPGWGKESTRPAWWPETLPWANVRSDARDESEKQRISWTTTLRQIVTNCYKFHGRDDLLPSFDESEESARQQAEQEEALGARRVPSAKLDQLGRPASGASLRLRSAAGGGAAGEGRAGSEPMFAAAAYAQNFVHTIANADGTVSLIQMDPANAQILTLPDGTQVRAVRLQTLQGGGPGGEDSFGGQQVAGELQEAIEIDPSLLAAATGAGGGQQQHAVALGEAQLGADGQIIVTGEDGTQSCYPVSSLVSIPASMYQQLAGAGQQLSIVAAEGAGLVQALASDQPQDQLQSISMRGERERPAPSAATPSQQQVEAGAGESGAKAEESASA